VTVLNLSQISLQIFPSILAAVQLQEH
jgi:hypothetical protein